MTLLATKMTNIIIPMIIMIYTLSNILRPLVGYIITIEYLLVYVIVILVLISNSSKYLILKLKKSKIIFFILFFLACAALLAATYGYIQHYQTKLIISDLSKFLMPLLLFILYWGYSTDDIRSSIYKVILVTVFLLIVHLIAYLFFGFNSKNINYYFSIMPIVLFMLATEDSVPRKKACYLYLILALLFFPMLSSLAMYIVLFVYLFIYLFLRYKISFLIFSTITFSIFLLIQHQFELFDNISLGAGRLSQKFTYLFNPDFSLLSRLDFASGGRITELYSALSSMTFPEAIIGKGMGATLVMNDQVQDFERYHYVYSHSMHSIVAETYFKIGIIGILSISFLYIYPLIILKKFKRKFGNNETAGLIALMIAYIQLAIIGQPMAGGFYFSMLIIVYILKKNQTH